MEPTNLGLGAPCEIPNFEGALRLGHLWATTLWPCPRGHHASSQSGLKVDRFFSGVEMNQKHLRKSKIHPETAGKNRENTLSHRAMSSSPPIEVPDGDEAEKVDGPQPPKAAALTAWRFSRDQDCVKDLVGGLAPEFYFL